MPFEINEEKEDSGKIRGNLQHFGLIAGPLISGLLLLFFDLDSEHPELTRTAAVALLMAIWWITEAIPLAITSLIPIVLFPLLGIMNGKSVSTQYVNHIIFLFIGGFLVAIAMQKWDLHKRIALRILLLFGVHPKAILLGFMVATAFLSMWISNTATTMMMVPIVLAVILKLEETMGREVVARYSIGLLLGIAYSATIGGIATLVGTPPNLSFVRIFAINFPNAPEISFASWFAFALPISIIFHILTWLILSHIFCSGSKKLILEEGVIKKQYEELGPITYEEKIVLTNFLLLAFLWLFRADIRIGILTIPGWSRLFSEPKFINDGTVAITIAVLLFMLPSKKERGSNILTMDAISKLPWHIILLFGGGFALAAGFKHSGLSLWLGTQLQGMGALDPLFLIGIICFLITFLTELTSNTATSEMILPVLAGLSIAIKTNPLMLMIPGTLSCSFAFMLPVATPPNAIIFGTDRIRIIDMVKIGIFLNILGVIIITLGTYIFGFMVLGIDTTVFPDWANIQ